MSLYDQRRPVHQSGPLRVQLERWSQHPMWQGDISGLRIVRLARERWGADTGINYGTSQVSIWMQLRSGRMRLDDEAGSVIAQAGSCLAVPAACPYRFWVDAAADAELWIMNCDGPACDRWWAHMARRQPMVLTLARRGEAEWLCERMLDHMCSQRSSDRWTACLYMQAYHSLLAADQECLGEQTSAVGRLVDRCREMVEREGLLIESVSALADGLGVGSDYLARCCRKLGVSSPGDQLRLRRMQEAAHYLSSTDRSVADIAEALGFSDSFAFSKAFKHYAGLSPRAWRQHFTALSPGRYI